jgi:hypothetical protein
MQELRITSYRIGLKQPLKQIQNYLLIVLRQSAWRQHIFLDKIRRYLIDQIGIDVFTASSHARKHLRVEI